MKTKKRQKGFSLFETMVTLAILATMMGLFGAIFKTNLKNSQGLDNISSAHQGSLALSETMTSKMRYTSAPLINFYAPLKQSNSGSDNGSEVLAIGFPALKATQSFGTYPEWSLDLTHLKADSFEYSTGISSSSSSDGIPFNEWGRYIVYYLDKSNKSSATDKTGTLYEMQFTLPESNTATVLKGKKYLTMLQKEKLESELTIDDQGLQTLKARGWNKKRIIATNIVAMRVYLNKYPAIKLSVEVGYGKGGLGSSTDRSGRNRTDGYYDVSETFEISWTVLPLN